MSARDGAITAALATGVPIHKGYIAEVVDAIPAAVLAQLAIDRGAFVQDWLKAYEDDHGWRILYRLGQPDEWDPDGPPVAGDPHHNPKD